MPVALRAPLSPTGNTRDDLSSWMASIPDKKPIADINIPGTHDSGAIAKGLNRLLPFHLYSRQSRSITQQLQSGVRILDVRIQITKHRHAHPEGTPRFAFNVVHGGVLAAMNLNKFQCLDSLLKEVTYFLAANPSECVIMSVKADNYKNFSKDRKAKADEKKHSLESLRMLLNKYPNYVYKFANKPDDVPATDYVAELNLGDVRGKILLFNRIEDLNENCGSDGIPVVQFKVDDNPKTVELINGTRIFIQDRYKKLGGSDVQQAKLELVNHAFDMKEHTEKTVVWSFASATHGLFGLFLVNIHKLLLTQFGEVPASGRKTDLGWVLFDFAVSTKFKCVEGDKERPIDLVSYIIDSNFGFQSFGSEFQIESWTPKDHLLSII